MFSGNDAASYDRGLFTQLSSFIRTTGEEAPMVSAVSFENTGWSSSSLSLLIVDNAREFLFQWWSILEAIFRDPIRFIKFTRNLVRK